MFIGYSSVVATLRHTEAAASVKIAERKKKAEKNKIESINNKNNKIDF